jgi:GH25 family lysozyme M1 (1,4-beta-N-acetylmuramidase)
LASRTRYHPYYQIVSGNQQKTVNITKDFSQFEPDTVPKQPNGGVGISYWMKLVPDSFPTIK